MNQKGHEPRVGTKKSTNQKQQKPKTLQTNNGMNQKGHEPGARTKKSTNQKGHKPKIAQTKK